MNRTFWPAQDAEDLPDSTTLKDRLPRWVHDWFGASAAVQDLVLTSEPPADDVIWFQDEGAPLGGLLLPTEYADRLAAKFPLFCADTDVLESHAADIVRDALEALCPSSDQLRTLAAAGAQAHPIPDCLCVRISAGDVSHGPIELLLTADGYFGSPAVEAGENIATKTERALAGTSVRIGVEKKIAVNVEQLLNLSGNEFLPIGELQDIGFELSANGYPIGSGFLGHVDNQLAVVVER